MFGATDLYVVAVLIPLAFRSALVFYIREGWKFRERLRPSGLYTGVSTVRCLIAGVVAAVVDAIVLAMTHSNHPDDPCHD